MGHTSLFERGRVYAVSAAGLCTPLQNTEVSPCAVTPAIAAVQNSCKQGSVTNRGCFKPPNLRSARWLQKPAGHLPQQREKMLAQSSLKKWMC
eukprot:3941899-Rhodomonas_salina.4